MKSPMEQIIGQMIESHMKKRGVKRGHMRQFAATYGLSLDELGRVKRGERWNDEVANCLEKVLGIPKESLPRQRRTSSKKDKVGTWV